MNRPAIERFEEKIERIPFSGCWIWTGALDSGGYGRFLLNGRVDGAHRASFLLMESHIPNGMYVCHRCDVKLCVNPSHLFLGTPTDNVRDMVNKGRQNIWQKRITHCPQGHEYTPANTSIYERKRQCKECERNRRRKDSVAIRRNAKSSALARQFDADISANGR